MQRRVYLFMIFFCVIHRMNYYILSDQTVFLYMRRQLSKKGREVITLWPATKLNGITL